MKAEKLGFEKGKTTPGKSRIELKVHYLRPILYMRLRSKSRIELKGVAVPSL